MNSSIRDAYRNSWKELKQFHLDGVKDNDEKRTLDERIIDYERSITGHIRILLHEFIKDSSEKFSNKFQIGRGIIQLNSMQWNKRIRIPVNGILGNWEKNQNEWENLFFKGKSSNGRDLMYLQPDRPNHLLTELMWRFQPKKADENNPEVVSFAIFRKDTITESLITKIKDIKQKNIKFLILEQDTLTNKNKQKKILNNLNHKILAKNPKTGDFEYKLEDCNTLLKKPLHILFDENSIYKGATNIFYIADIDESNYLGAFDFEIIPLKDFDSLTIEEFLNFIDNLRWNLSKYIIGLISGIERDFYSIGGVYRDVYFHKVNGENPGMIGLEDTINKIIKIKLDTPDSLDNEKILQVFTLIKSHFQIANSDIGLYWKGYKRYAFEVSCCVALIIEELFLRKENVADNNQFHLEKTLRKCGPEFNDFFSEIETEKVRTNIELPFIFKQLFQGLVREKDLFLLPYYRDHFIHSFYCFCFGLILMAIAPERIIKKEQQLDLLSQKNGNSLELIKKWFIVSMWHDIAYTLEKGNSIIEKYILKFFQHKNKRFQKVLPWMPSLGNLLQVEGVLDNIRKISEDSIYLNGANIKLEQKYEELFPEKPDTLRGIDVSDIIIAVAFDHVDHGIWSSLFINHALSENKEIFSMHGLTNNEISKAIMPHHFSTWKFDNLFNDFKFYHYVKNKKDFLENLHKAISLDREKNALGYLLCLCDILSQAGREAIEIAEDLPSNLLIKYRSIHWDESNNNFEISLIHLNTDMSDDGIDKFYKKPLEFIRLELNKEIEKKIIDNFKGGIKIGLFNSMDKSISSFSYFIKNNYD